MRSIRFIFPVLVLSLLFTASAMAQAFEVTPYAGGFFPLKWAKTDRLEAQGMFGARVGGYTTENIEIDYNIAYANHFAFTGTDRKVGAIVWDFNGSYNFAVERMNRVEPFVTAGIGGVTADVRGKSSIVFMLPTAMDGGRGDMLLNDHDTFLALNYGGGFKALRAWGPMGWRWDVRMRHMPNFFGHSSNWFETTAGVTIAWGER
jgi:hypothetical protein